MTQPQTFREIRKQVDQLNEDACEPDYPLQAYDEARMDLDIWCSQMVRDREGLLDAAPEMLQILEAILSDRDGLGRLQAFTRDGELFDPREVIAAVIAKAKGGTT